MAALATLADLEAVTGTEVAEGADTDRAERLLELASAAIERWCNRTFTYTADDEITVNVTDGTLYLPNGPITAVTSITGPTVWGVAGSLVDAAGYQVVNGHVVRRYGWWGCGDYDIVYSHGYQEIPDDVILAVCQIVERVLASPGVGIRQEATGPFSVTYAESNGLGLSAVERELLTPYRVTVSSVQMVR